MRAGYHRTVQICKMKGAHIVTAFELEGADLTFTFPLWQPTQAAATCFRFDLEFWLGSCDLESTSIACVT